MLLILNDIHVGFNRKGGVTPATAEALRSYLLKQLEEKLYDHDGPVMIMGDLFDQFEVSSRDWLAVWQILSDFLARGGHLTLVAGNHDWSPKGNRMSSFEMLCKVLIEQSANFQFVRIDGWTVVDEHVIAVAHCSNQDIFDAKLEEIMAQAGDDPWDQHEAIRTHVFVHANYDNDFAAQSDHSLNVSQSMAKRFIDKGLNLVFAHEHQARREMPAGAAQTGAEVIVLGNQWPTSIADCLGNDAKFAHVLDAGELTKVKTWDCSMEGCGFYAIDWRQLDALYTPAGFIRVSGDASASEAAEVINKIAAFRRDSAAFIVSNAVKVDGVAAVEEMSDEAIDAIKSFSLMDFIRDNKYLEPDEIAVVEGLLKDEA